MSTRSAPPARPSTIGANPLDLLIPPTLLAQVRAGGGGGRSGRRQLALSLPGALVAKLERAAADAGVGVEQLVERALAAAVAAPSPRAARRTARR